MNVLVVLRRGGDRPAGAVRGDRADGEALAASLGEFIVDEGQVSGSLETTDCGGVTTVDKIYLDAVTSSSTDVFWRLQSLFSSGGGAMFSASEIRSSRLRLDDDDER